MLTLLMFIFGLGLLVVDLEALSAIQVLLRLAQFLDLSLVLMTVTFALQVVEVLTFMLMQ